MAINELHNTQSSQTFGAGDRNFGRSWAQEAGATGWLSGNPGDQLGGGEDGGRGGGDGSRGAVGEEGGAGGEEGGLPH